MSLQDVQCINGSCEPALGGFIRNATRLSGTACGPRPTHHVDLQVNGEADVVGHVILSHVHNVVQLVGDLLGGFLFINDRPAPLQDATTESTHSLLNYTPPGVGGDQSPHSTDTKGKSR